MTRWASEQLVSAALSHEPLATERLIAAIWPSCFRLAASLIGDRNLAQDAAQESCVIVHRKVRTLRDPRAFDTWMYRIVMREASRIQRRYAAAPPALYEFAFSEDTTEVMDVWRALTALSPRLREIAVLFYFDDLKTEEIGAILRIPHATVRTRLARVRERLRLALDDYGLEPQAEPKKVEQHAC